MVKNKNTGFSLPSLSLRDLVGGLSLFLIGVNALTAVIGVWVGNPDILGKIFLSSMNLFVSVLIAYYLIEKLLVKKGTVPGVLSLLSLLSMFFVTEYLILKPEASVNQQLRESIGGTSSYIIFLLIIGLNTLLAHIATSPYYVRLLASIAMIFAYLWANIMAYMLLVGSSDIVIKLAWTAFLLALFAVIAIPVVKLLSKEKQGA